MLLVLRGRFHTWLLPCVCLGAGHEQQVSLVLVVTMVSWRENQERFVLCLLLADVHHKPALECCCASVRCQWCSYSWSGERQCVRISAACDCLMSRQAPRQAASVAFPKRWNWSEVKPTQASHCFGTCRPTPEPGSPCCSADFTTGLQFSVLCSLSSVWQTAGV